MLDFSPMQMLIVLAIALIVFGPKRLPEMARNLGKGIREFKAGIDMGGQDPAPTSTVRAAAAPAAAPAPAPLTAASDDEDLSGLVRRGDDQPAGAAGA